MTRRPRSAGGCAGCAIADAPRDQLGRAQLTERQREVMEFIKNFQAEHGWPPTLREIAAAFEFASQAGAQQALIWLERKGWIKRGSGARQITIVA